MSKFRINMDNGSGNTPTHIGTYNTIEEAAEQGWNYAHNRGITNSSCENHDSVVEALVTRQYCMLAYGPNSLEIEEIV